MKHSTFPIVRLFTPLFILLLHSLLYANPPLQHGSNFLEVHEDAINIKHYYISEKLDGVRGYWTGKQLLTRQGNPISAPDWFTENFGPIPLDGELWIDRDQFERVSGIVRTEIPSDHDWRDVQFMIFDLPNYPGPFNERVVKMREIVTEQDVPWLKKIPQIQVNTIDEMQQYHQEIIQKRGEGLMLHHQDAYYHSGRVNHLLKVKEHHDAEGIVIEHFEGNGKFKGMLGSMLIEIKNGTQFKIGSGFTHEERENPPEIGECITFQYNGYTNNDIPRFARFLRIRHDRDSQTCLE